MFCFLFLCLGALCVVVVCVVIVFVSVWSGNSVDGFVVGVVVVVCESRVVVVGRIKGGRKGIVCVFV